MIFVLNTNVMSETTKANPDANVLAFLRALPLESQRVSSMVIAEIAQGVENNPTASLQAFLADVLALPIADFGEAEALEWGRITSKALKSGISAHARDSIIAATAKVRGWTVATSNTQDFIRLGVSVFNPWTDRL